MVAARLHETSEQTRRMKGKRLRKQRRRERPTGLELERNDGRVGRFALRLFLQKVRRRRLAVRRTAAARTAVRSQQQEAHICKTTPTPISWLSTKAGLFALYKSEIKSKVRQRKEYR